MLVPSKLIRSALAVALLITSGITAAGPAYPASSRSAYDVPESTSQETYRFVAVADAFVTKNRPKKTYGALNRLRVDAAPLTRTYLKFKLDGLQGTIVGARLRLHARSNLKGRVYAWGAKNRWREKRIRFSNAPSLARAAAGSRRRFTRGSWRSIDVTPAVTGNGVLTLGLTTPSRKGVTFSSRQSKRRPKLIVRTTLATDPQPDVPIRAAFYYPWFPEAWKQQGFDPFTQYRPSLGFYDSSSARVIRQHILSMRYAGIEAAISSWWGQDHRTDDRFSMLLDAAAATSFRWALYYEPEGQGDPSAAQIAQDLAYIRDNYGRHPAYLRVNGRLVIFVWASGSDDGCEMAERWKQGNAIQAYVVLKVFSGYRSCGNQPDSWHQYGPATANSNQAPYSFTVSPGFWKKGEDSPRLARDLVRWRTDVTAMESADVSWRLITTFNEWGEGTSIESAGEWRSFSGHGDYLDVLAGIEAAPVGAAPVIAAAGDIACDPASSSFRDGQGTTSACRQMATSELLVNKGLDAVLPLGDTQYEDGEYSKFLESYDPSWGRVKSITRPAIGNHEYLTPDAAGYFRYFGSAAGDPSKGYYSFDVGKWHLIALNSMCSKVSCDPGGAQERWLRNDLAEHPTRCTLAYMHHPRFSSGQHGGDVRVQDLWQTLYDAGADVVLAGHDHVYERFAPQDPEGALDTARGIREFVVGSGGKNLTSFDHAEPNSEVRNDDTFGVLMLTLRGRGYEWRFVPEEGKTFTDSGSDSCH